MLNTTLEGIVADVALDCWKSPLDEAWLEFGSNKTGSFGDGSKTYGLNVSCGYRRADNDIRGIGGREHTINIQLDANERFELDKYVASAENLLKQYGIRAKQEGNRLVIGIRWLREPNLKPSDIARIITAAGKRLAEAEVVESHRQRYGAEPTGVSLNRRELFDIGYERGLTDKDLLAGIRKYYSKSCSG